MRKLKAVVDDLAMGDFRVTVTDHDTGEEFVVITKAADEKEAAFKAMDQINEQ